MEQTERIYFTDASVLEFSARVVEVRPSSEGEQVVLDKTAFYPTGGGQPNDTGLLNEARVVDVYEDEAGTIFHLVKQSGQLQVGENVTGLIDRARRLDHMQQHSGQHILSQAFVQACNAQTRSFHLGAQTSTIDIELYSPTDDHMRAAEEVANQVIFDDRLMRVHMVSEEEAMRLPLRKELAVRGDIRVIEITDFDWSPCGGTHAARTGQIGLIAIKSYERAKKMTRVEFVCGRRALSEYRQASSIASAVARLFSADRDAAPELASRAIEENKALKKRLRDLLEIATTAEAAGLLAESEATNNFKIIRRAFDDRDVEEIRLLASKIVSLEPAVALLGTRDKSSARLVFARSASLAQEMGKLMAEACSLLGGRGGGRSDMAQGGGPLIEKLEEALANAALAASA
ncbi:MAG TPA: alanyl-tRNA editing protein [Blastocatellia bacterium]|nr:alanyl-tRNA editing protein [Blastocatellia bacterium]